MAPLPRCQFPSTDVPYPFANAGVDAFGPFFVVNGKRTEKHYSLIFTCLVTRACHLQPPCPALTTDSFINAFRRIIARRGQLQYIRSDNGKNFICVRRELQETLKAAIRTSSTSSCDGMAPQSIVRATLWWSVGTPYPNGQEDSTTDLGFQKTDNKFATQYATQYATMPDIVVPRQIAPLLTSAELHRRVHFRILRRYLRTSTTVWPCSRLSRFRSW